MQRQTNLPSFQWRTAYLTDLILWAAIFALAGLAGFYFFIYKPSQARQTVTLHFRDANEIGPGAMVRMMGLDIGFVHHVAVKPDHVEVTLKTYPNMPPIPNCATATVLFTGLVGAKSIELRQPTQACPKTTSGSHTDQPHVIVQEPIRLKDTLDYQNEIAWALQGGAENFADFFGKKKPVEELQYNIATAELVMNDVADRMVRAKNIVDKTHHQMSSTTGGLINSLAGFTRTTHETALILESQALEETAPIFMKSTLGTLADMNTHLKGISQSDRLSLLLKDFQNASISLRSLTQNTKPWIDKRQKLSSQWVDHVQSFHGTMTLLHQTTSNGLENPIHQAQQTLKRWNRYLIKVNQSL
ncbi:MAG: MCE family protein [Vampirovibrio sp.]|nr:MCE family protein [Vampirovibrio sp.]